MVEEDKNRISDKTFRIEKYMKEKRRQNLKNSKVNPIFFLKLFIQGQIKGQILVLFCFFCYNFKRFLTGQ